MAVQRARRVWLPSPKTIEIQEIDLEPMGERSVLVKSVLSGISHGTEMALYNATAPTLTKTFDRKKRLFPDVEPKKEFAGRTLGYENVGQVVQVGPQVTALQKGDLIWCFAPHMDYYIFEEGKPMTSWPPPLGYYSVKLPSNVTPEQGIFTALAGVALAAVQDAAVKVGDYVVVFGAGAIGLLCTQLALLNGARCVFVSEPQENRRNMAVALGAIGLDPTRCDVAMAVRDMAGGRAADVSIEASGNQKAIHQAIRCTGMGGNVVTLGFYQGGAPDLRLGEEWHHNRVTMRSSMTAWLCPSRYYPQWDPLRGYETVVDLMARGQLKVENLITQRVPFERAAEAYRLVDEHPRDVLKVALSYS